MVEEKTTMKYIRTYETEEKFLTDKDSTSRGFRLKPTLYKYSETGDHIHLELDDPRKHGDSTYIKIYIDSDIEFSFYIGNKPGDTQTTMTCTIDWGDGVIEDKNITADDKGFKLSHNYKAGSYSIELYAIEDYSIIGDATNSKSLISHPSSVKRVILGSGVVSIGNYAFRSCGSLSSIHIPEGVTSIGNYVFSYCTSLTSVYIPESVTSIGKSAFYSCSSLTSVYIPNSVISIGTYVFTGCSSLISVNIPESVTSIETSMFSGCSSLTSVYIPNSVTSIKGSMFNGCSSLTSVYIPNSVISIGTYVFNGCSSLISVNIPESVTSIETGALNGCSSLTSVNIPESVTIVGNSVFYNCSSLTSISSLNTTAPTLGSSVFENLPIDGTLHIKPGATGYDAWLSKLPSGWRIVEDL